MPEEHKEGQKEPRHCLDQKPTPAPGQELQRGPGQSEEGGTRQDVQLGRLCQERALPPQGPPAVWGWTLFTLLLYSKKRPKHLVATQ